MIKKMIALMAVAVLITFSSNVGNAAEVNPNPIGKPVGGGKVLEGKEGKGDGDCFYKHQVCINGDYTESDFESCRSGRAGRSCRQINQKARCDIADRKCRKKEAKAMKNVPSTSGVIMQMVPMKQFNMVPTQ